MTAPGWRRRTGGRIRRLPVPGVHQRDRVQPDRHAAAVALGEADDAAAVGDLAGHGRAGDREGGQRAGMSSRIAGSPGAGEAERRRRAARRPADARRSTVRDATPARTSPAGRSCRPANSPGGGTPDRWRRCRRTPGGRSGRSGLAAADRPRPRRRPRVPARPAGPRRTRRRTSPGSASWRRRTARPVASQGPAATSASCMDSSITVRRRMSSSASPAPGATGIDHG